MLREMLIEKVLNLRDRLHGKIAKLETDLRDPKKKAKLRKSTKNHMKKKVKELHCSLEEMARVLNRLSR
jgi:hypothetical protein